MVVHPGALKQATCDTMISLKPYILVSQNTWFITFIFLLSVSLMVYIFFERFLMYTYGSSVQAQFAIRIGSLKFLLVLPCKI